jgi:predicted glycosyltransferase
MRIVIDINHPAHVHYFKHFIWKMQKRGHEIRITASEKDITYQLLQAYGFDFIRIGTYGKSLFRKAINIVLLDLVMYNSVKKFNPDLFMGFGSIRAAHVSFLLQKPCILLEDTEHSTEQILLYLPFIKKILTPECFQRNMGLKHIKFNGYTELAYLHPHYFTPNPSVLDELGVGKNEPYILLRFVSWDASHDIGQHGIRNKYDLVKDLEQFGRVFISSEKPLPPELQRYSLTLTPEKIHDVLYFAQLYMGEGGTMATEAALLGTPAIFVSSLAGTMGNFSELETRYTLMFSYKNPESAQKKAIELLHHDNLKEEWKSKREKLLNDKIDVTAFLIDFIERYHETSNHGKAL